MGNSVLKPAVKLKNEILVTAKVQHPVILFLFTRWSNLIYPDLRKHVIYIIKDQNLAETG